MTEGLREKITRIGIALDNYQEGKPLPVSLADLHFLIGASSTLLSNINKLESTYKIDLAAASSDVEKFRDRWKDARAVSTRRDNDVMSGRQVITHARNLSWWRKTKPLKLALASYDSRVSKNKI